MSFVSPPIDYYYHHLEIVSSIPLENVSATVVSAHDLDVVPAAGFNGFVTIPLNLLTALNQNIGSVTLALHVVNGQLDNTGSVVVPSPIVEVDGTSGQLVYTLINVDSLKGDISDWSIRADFNIDGLSDSDSYTVWADVDEPFTVTDAVAAAGNYGGGSYGGADYVTSGSTSQLGLRYHPGATSVPDVTYNKIVSVTPQIHVNTAAPVNGSPVVYPEGTTTADGVIARVFGLEAMRDAYPKFRWALDGVPKLTGASTLENFPRRYQSKSTTTGNHTVSVLGVRADGSTQELGSITYNFG